MREEENGDKAIYYNYRGIRRLSVLTTYAIVPQLSAPLMSPNRDLARVLLDVFLPTHHRYLYPLVARLRYHHPFPS